MSRGGQTTFERELSTWRAEREAGGELATCRRNDSAASTPALVSPRERTVSDRRDFPAALLDDEAASGRLW